MIKTVGDLRRLLKGVPDNLELVVRAQEERDDGDDVDFCGALLSAEIETHHEMYFALDCGIPEQPLLTVVKDHEEELDDG